MCLKKLCILHRLVFADDPKPEVGAAGASTAASSRAQAAEDSSKRLDQVREICPDLVEEIKEDWDKKEVCKKCGDKVSFFLQQLQSDKSLNRCPLSWNQLETSFHIKLGRESVKS